MKVHNRTFETGERIATTRQVRAYKREYKKLGISVVVDKKGKVLGGTRVAGFDYSRRIIYINKTPGIIDLYHEGYHAQHFLELGQERYVALGSLAREEYVYKKIMDNSHLFNSNELSGATRYINSLRSNEMLQKG